MIGLLWLKVYYVQDAGVLWHHVNFGMPLQNRVDPFGNLFRTHPTLERRLAQLDALEHQLGQAS